MESILARSQATESFKHDVLRFAAGDGVGTIDINGYAPRVKVYRVLLQLLSSRPELAIQRVTVRGVSGCSDFVGDVVVETPTEKRAFSFSWCCRWRAEQEGWTDYFGFPDQIRAAREFDWDCFERWEEKSGTTADQSAFAPAPRLEGLTA